MQTKIEEKPKKRIRNTIKTGRPRKTLKDFNLPDNWKQVIYEMSAKGCSEVEIRAYFLMCGGEFSQKTWDKLKEREGEFLLTIQQAKILCQAWWEKVSRENLFKSTFQTGSWYANMKNRFGWRDKQEIEHNLGEEVPNILQKYEAMDINDFKNKIAAILGQKV